MTRAIRRWFLVCLVIFNFGVLLALGVSLVQARKERAGLQSENNEMSEKIALVLEKYREERRRVEGLQRSQFSAEGQRRTLQNEVAKLKEENASLRSQERASEKRLMQEVASLTVRAEELSKQAADVQAAYDALRQEHTRAKKDCERILSKLTEKNRGLDAELKRKEQGLALCNADNAELCALVDDLLAQYESKGVVHSILQKEPLIQKGRAEVEKLLQEYRDKKSRHSSERFREPTLP